MVRFAMVLVAASVASGAFAQAVDQVDIETVTLVSTNAQGVPANGWSYGPRLSPDGTLLAFASVATNLTGDPAGGYANIFVKDLTSGSVRLVTRTIDGRPANGSSETPIFSPDGSKIAFVSSASNLVAGDTNRQSDIFLANLETGSLKRLSTRSRTLQANGASSEPRFTTDGKFILFTTTATNLLPHKDIRARHIIRKSLSSGTTSCVSCNSRNKMAQGYGTAISPDGIRVGFISHAAFLGSNKDLRSPNVYIKNLISGNTSNATALNDGQYNAIDIAPGGKYVAGLSSSKGNKGFFYGDGKLHLVRISTREDLVIDTPYIEDRLPQQRVVFSADGSVLLSMCNEIKLHFFQKIGDRLVPDGSGSVSKWPDEELRPLFGAEMTPDARQIVYAGPRPKLTPTQTDETYGLYLVRWKRTPAAQDDRLP